MMSTHTRIRTLGFAALLALFAMGPSVGQADAKPKTPGDNGVRCSAPGVLVGSLNDLEFFMPGDEIVFNGPDGKWHRFKCGEDGNWYPVRVATSTGPVAPRPVGNAP